MTFEQTARAESVSAFSPLEAISLLKSEGVQASEMTLLEDGEIIKKKHQVYNFEVEGHHTYIADGIRVHNTSILNHLKPGELANVDWSTVADTTGDGGLDYVQIDTIENGYKAGATIYKHKTVNGQEYIEGFKTFTDKDGNLVQMQFERDANGVLTGVPKIIHLTGAQFGEQAGELITPYLTAAIIGEDAGMFETIAVNTILGTFLENLFEFTGGFIHDQLASRGLQDNSIEPIADHTFSDIVGDLGANAGDYTSQALTGWIMAEVFGGISTDSFGGEFLNALVSQGVGYLVDSGLHALTEILPSSFDGAFLTGFSEATVPSGDFLKLPNIQGLLWSTALNRILPAIETIEGQIASGLTTLALNTFASGLGSGLSTVFGTFNPVVFIIARVVGKLFDSLFEKHPQAYSNVIFNEETGYFEVGNSWSEDNGDVVIGQQMANYYVDFMNGVLDQTQAQSHNAAELTDAMRLVFGHYEQNIQNGAERNFTELDAAVQSRIIDTLQELELNDGDLVVLKAIADVVVKADFQDDITHFGSYYTWKKFLWIKISKKWHYTEINPEVTSGMTTDEIVEVVENWDSNGNDSDFEAAVLAQFNSLYSDLQIASLSDNAGVQQILDRLSSKSWAHNLQITESYTYEEREDDGGSNYLTRTRADKAGAVDIISDALYLRAINLQLESLGYNPTTKAQLIADIQQEQLSVASDPSLFAEIQHALQIAAEYREYLNNKEAYDAAIQAAGPDSGYAQAWALTFMEADRLGFTDTFTATGDDVDNFFLGGSGGDEISGLVGADTIRGLAGDDTLLGGEGADSLDGGTGNDVVEGGDGNDLALGGSGNDYVRGNRGDDSISGGQGNDFLFGGNDDDTVSGGEGDDLVKGDLGSDLLQGDEGNDTLKGWTGDDTLAGGSGIDDLTGGDGADTFVIAVGDGHDIVRDFEVGVDKIAIGVEISEVVVFDDGRDTRVVIDENTSLLLKGISSSELTVSDFQLATTQTLSLATGIGFASEGTIGNDSIEGTDFADIISGGLGSDSIRAFRGDDFLEGGDGNDTLDGGSNNDTVHGGNGDDTVQGVNGDDLLFGDAGDDSLAGWNGNDTLDGGAGNDLLRGGPGDDIFVVRDGYDNDIIADFVVGEDRIDLGTGDKHVNVVNENDGARLFVGLNSSVLLLGIDASQVSASDFIISNGTLSLTSALEGSSAGDNLTGSDFFDQILGNGGNDTIFGYRGDDILEGGTGNDSIDAGSDDDIVHGGDGNDIIFGVNGNDLLFGESGADTLRGWNGDDTLDGGAGDDQLGGADGVDVLLGGDGFDTLWGGSNDDELNGGAGNDTIWGGTGSDDLTGGSGNDTFEFGLGDGHDVIRDFNVLEDIINIAPGAEYFSLSDVTGGTLIDYGAGSIFVEGVTSSAIAGAISGGLISGTDSSETITGTDLANVIDVGDGADTVNALDGDDTIIASSGADSIQGGEGRDAVDYSTSSAHIIVDLKSGSASSGFAEGDTLTSIEHIVGSQFDDVIKGRDYSDILEGGDGNDSLYGNKGSDTIFGGNGDDLIYGKSHNNELWGGTGNDTIYTGDHASVAHGGDGSDTIYITSKNSGTSRVSGGSGADLFVFSNPKSGKTAKAEIQDFEDGLDSLSIAGVAVISDVTITQGESGAIIHYNDNEEITLVGIDASSITAEDFDGMVPSPNTPPVANADATTTEFEQSVTISVLNNDSDADGDTLILTGVSSPANGTATISGTQVIYTPNNGFSGSDTFTYTVSDGNGGSSSSTVTVDVDDEPAPTNIAPDAANDAATTAYQTATTLSVLANDTDPDGDAISLQSVGSPANGTAVISGSQIIYTPNSGFSGADTFTYSVSDGNGGTSTATVSVTVEDPPAAGTISGTNSSETLNGDANANIFSALDGDDTINALAGDDTVIASSGADSILGGDGIDLVDYSNSASNVVIDLRSGVGSSGYATGDLLSSIEHLKGSQFGDTLRGSDSSDLLEGGDGDDYLYGYKGSDTIFGGNGDDRLYGSNHGNHLFGEDGNDIIYTGAHASTVDGGAGDDTIYVTQKNGGTSNIVGGSGADSFIFSIPKSGKLARYEIADFENGIDSISISGVTSIGDVTITDDNGDTKIGFNDNEEITLLGVNSSAIGADDFVF